MNLSSGPWPGALRIRHLPAVNALAFLLLALLVLLLDGCVTGGDLYLVSTLSDQQKARALVSAGALAYDARLVKGADYGAIDEVALYFKQALAFDPDNADASRYAALVSGYRTAKLAAAKKEASDILKRTKRSEAEEYAAALAIQKAVSLDASDEGVKALLKQSVELRSGLVETFLARAQTEMDKVTEDSSASTREKAWVAAWNQTDKAIHVEPRSLKAQATAASLRGKLEAIVKDRLVSFDALLAKKAWPEARTQLLSIKDLDGKLDGVFSTQLAQKEYDLYFKWASALLAAKNYAEAGTRVDAALLVKKSAEALELKKKATAGRTSLEVGGTIESGLQNIAKAIDARDFARAQRLIAALAAMKLDTAQKKRLEEQRARLGDAQEMVLSDGYERGVKAYKEERFKDAIAALAAVVDIDPVYKDAADYLDKARTKQRVLDGF